LDTIFSFIFIKFIVRPLFLARFKNIMRFGI
jgi:hypothetical protein